MFHSPKNHAHRELTEGLWVIWAPASIPHIRSWFYLAITGMVWCCHSWLMDKFNYLVYSMLIPVSDIVTSYIIPTHPPHFTSLLSHQHEIFCPQFPVSSSQSTLYGCFLEPVTTKVLEMGLWLVFTLVNLAGTFIDNKHIKQQTLNIITKTWVPMWATRATPLCEEPMWYLFGCLFIVLGCYHRAGPVGLILLPGLDNFLAQVFLNYWADNQE